MKSLSNISKLLTGLIVLFIFSLPIIGVVLTPPNATLTSEKRTVSPWPKDINRYFLNNASKFIKDRLLFRPNLMESIFPHYVRNFRNFDLKSTSPIKGSDGFWFLSDNYEYVNLQYSIPLNPEYFKPMIDNFLAQRAFLIKETQLPFILAIVPDKQDIYPEYMPPFNEPGKYRLPLYFIKYAKQKGFNIYDSYNDFISNKNTALLFYRQDSHWNMLGGYIFYKSLMKNLGINAIDVNFIPLENKTNGCDLIAFNVGNYEPTDNYLPIYANKINVKYFSDYDPSKIFYKYNLEAMPDARMMNYIFENENAPVNNTILLIADSTSDSSIAYYYATFKKVILTDGTFQPFREYVRLAKKYKADFIINQIVERHVGIGADFHAK